MHTCTHTDVSPMKFIKRPSPVPSKEAEAGPVITFSDDGEEEAGAGAGPGKAILRQKTQADSDNDEAILVLSDEDDEDGGKSGRESIRPREKKPVFSFPQIFQWTAAHDYIRITIDADMIRRALGKGRTGGAAARPPSHHPDEDPDLVQVEDESDGLRRSTRTRKPSVRATGIDEDDAWLYDYDAGPDDEEDGPDEDIATVLCVSLSFSSFSSSFSRHPHLSLTHTIIKLEGQRRTISPHTRAGLTMTRMRTLT